MISSESSYNVNNKPSKAWNLVILVVLIGEIGGIGLIGYVLYVWSRLTFG